MGRRDLRRALAEAAERCRREGKERWRECLAEELKRRLARDP
jgi:hypothetical protein